MGVHPPKKFFYFPLYAEKSDRQINKTRISRKNFQIQRYMPITTENRMKRTNKATP